MKDGPFLTHDIGARNDPKLLELQMEMGGAGLAIYWCLVEMLWENSGYLPLKYRQLAFSLRWCSPEEVERVVTEFGLFENDEEQFWSPSALRRINYRDGVSAKKSAAGKASRGGRKAASEQEEPGSDGADAKQVLDGCSADVEHMISKCSTDAEQMSSNKLINNINNINKINYSFGDDVAEEKQEIFEIFFFEKNFNAPGYELARFWNYYDGNGWTWGDGKKVADRKAVAKLWKPENPEPRFDREVLNWYKAVYIAAMDAGAAGAVGMLGDLLGIDRDGDKLTLKYRSKTTATGVATFIRENDLAGTWKLSIPIKK